MILKGGSKAIQEIAVIGLGGVGGYFGFKLAQTFKNHPGVNVTFVARESTYEAVNRRGLILLSAEHQESAVQPGILLQNVSELSEIDLALICVKEYDLANVCRQLKGKVTDDSLILPLMNGVDIYDRIRAEISEGIVLPSCVYVASHIKDKGNVEHNGKAGEIIFGKDPRFPQYMPESIIDVFREAAIHFQYIEDPLTNIWTKFIFIAAFGLVTARYNLSIGEVNEDHGLREIASSIMKEIEAIARLKGVDLPDDIIDSTYKKASTFPYATPTSLQLDIHSGKENNELQLFAGAVLRYGEDVGTSTIATKKIYEEIKGL